MDAKKLTTANGISLKEPHEQLLARIGWSRAVEADKSPLEIFKANPCERTLRNINKRSQTIEMIVAALQEEIQRKQVYSSPILKWVSKKLLTPEVCKLACYQHHDNIQYIPTGMITKEMKDIAKKTKAQMDFRRATIMREQEMRRASQPTLMILNKDAREEMEHSPFIADTSPVSLPIPETTKIEMLVSSETHSMLHELDDLVDASVVPIYYISDIHLEHQLDLAGKTLSEVKELVRGKVSELISSIQDRRGLILVGGDIAHSIELEQIFFDTLRRMIPISIGTSDGMNILAVLGNHELWDGDPVKGSPRSVDDIIENYETVCRCYGKAILENTLWVKYHGCCQVFLGEKDLLEATDDELSGLCDQSTLMVLGGIGFSGLNPKFNAASGLYRQTVSTEEDAVRSARFRAVYDKVLRCAGSQRVIVLTHMPMDNWSNGQYNPGWIYISGHTHRNTLIRDRDGTTVLSDNQIGYKPKPWHFNCFTVQGRYDPFADWNDGIYTITREQYLNFNHARGVTMQFKSMDPVYMIKRDGTYMFFQKSGWNLYMLSGGRRCSADYDIEYYYDNLLLYKQRVKTAFEPYNIALQSISKEVKLFGGSGKIHGCIVDIDFWNHIYLNPFDGKITPYFALDMSQKYVFSTVAALIKSSSNSSMAFGSLYCLLDSFEKASTKGLLPILTGDSEDDKMVLATVPELVLDRSIYDPSRILRAIQYIFDQDIVRIWKDEVLNMVWEHENLDANAKQL